MKKSFFPKIFFFSRAASWLAFYKPVPVCALVFAAELSVIWQHFLIIQSKGKQRETTVISPDEHTSWFVS
jgi:hypothetical protein